MSAPPDRLRQLPGVDRLLQSPAFQCLIDSYGRELAVAAARAALDEARAQLRRAEVESVDQEMLAQLARSWLAAQLAPSLQPVINASGVILHTNLGRAPLSVAVLEAMAEAGRSYSNLEYDLAEGRRGSRYVHAEELLCRLTGAEAAVLVNNNAGAVLLVLSALAAGRRVVVSRGQLVEIGGGFRIPDVMAQSGATLAEVGTTNRTYVDDYMRATDEATVAWLRVHSSNFYQAGFVYQPSLAELVETAHVREVLMLDDLGSGTLLDTARFGLGHEPTVQESIAAGADIVTFSGDKLLGGPQAGIIVGRRALIETLRRHPLIRALRVDKTTIAGIQANLRHYVLGQAEREIPVWRMIAAPLESLRVAAAELVASLGEASARCRLVEGRSMVGGGSLPEQSLPTWLVAIADAAPEQLAAQLRQGKPPVIARVQDDALLLDMRTVLPGQESALGTRLAHVLHSA